jgi:hypothetical protein
VGCSDDGLCPEGLRCVQDRCVAVDDAGLIDAVVIDGPDVDAFTGVATSCKQLLELGVTTSGVYELDPDGAGGAEPFSTFCNQDLGGGGWTTLTSNRAQDTEPDGCQPRLASDSSFVCGDVVNNPTDDYAVPAVGIPFTEMIWAAHTGDFVITSYQLFGWDAPTQIPALEQWALVPDDSSQVLAELEATPIIECQYAPIGDSGLRRVMNQVPRVATGAYAANVVITFFDQDTLDNNPGKMTFTEGNAAAGSVIGLDDFQDGHGCEDLWAPIDQRGYSSFVMVR